MNILVLNGPNINLLGLREPAIYGHETFEDVIAKIIAHGTEKGVKVTCLQSNHEGDLVGYIQAAYGTQDGIVINPGAYTHTSVALLDALKGVSIPTVEIHISDPMQREEFRHISYVGYYAEKTIRGHGTNGYLEAIDYLVDTYKK